jgi:hypothetical protein
MRFSGHHLGTVDLTGTYQRSTRTGMPELLRATVDDPAFALSIVRTDGYKAERTYDSQKDSLRAQIKSSAQFREFYKALSNLVRQAKRHARRSKGKELVADPKESDPLATPPPSGQISASTSNELFRKLTSPQNLLVGSHLTALTSVLTDFRRSFNYIGSFREPQRNYFQVSKGDIRVQRDGQNYIEQIAMWEEEHAPQLRQVIRALRQLKLLFALRTSRVRNGMFEVQVRPTLQSARVSLADVGFGVGQVLPILVADLQLPKGGTLAVSQPEIHLHPSVQADLATYLVRRSATTTNRYIIETHSEYIINRVRLLVANGTLKAEDVSAVYLSNDGIRTTAHEIKFSTSGKIEGAPREFFDTYMMDVMNLAMAAGS